MGAGGAGGTDFRESDTVAMKRIEQDDQTPASGGPNATAVEFQAMRAGTTADGSGDERMSLFWRLFGGTILSIVALAAITVYNSLNTGIS